MAWRKPTNLNEWFGILIRHKKKFFFPAMTVMIVVIWASQFMERQYRAEAKFQRRSDTSFDGGTENLSAQIYERMRLMMQYSFNGRPAVEQLITDLNQTKGFPRTADGEFTTDGKLQYEDLIRQVGSRISVYSQVASEQIDLVSVSFTHTDRDLAPKVVNQLVENYIRKVKSEMDDQLLEQKKFYTQEVDRFRRKVSDLESAKLRFDLNNPGLDPENPLNAHNKLVDLRKSKEDLIATIKEEEAKLAELKEWEKNEPDFKQNKKKIENAQLIELRDKLKKLKELYDYNAYELRRTAAHPQMKDLVRRIADTEKEIANFVGGDDEEIEEVPNVEKIAAQKDIKVQEGGLVAKKKQVEETDKDIEAWEVRNRNFFAVRNEYLKITRELTESQDQLKFWDENLRRTTVALTLNVGERGMRLSFVQRAPELGKPSSPTLVKILAMAIFAGLGAGAFFVILAELLDHSYRSIEQAVDEIKLPVLGAINEIVSPATAMRRKIFAWGVFPLITTVLALLLTGVFVLTYLSLEAPHKYDQLRDNPVRFIMQQFRGV